MTKVLFHGSIQTFRGRIGNLIFRQLPDGTTVVTEAPPKQNSRQKQRAKLRRSTKQKAHNERFQEASAYARWASRTQPIYAELAAATVMRTAYNFALSDWFRAPEIHRIERQAGRIRVQASDNIQVVRVQVKLLDGEGSILETGEAVHVGGECWEYASQAEGKTVIAEARDFPGNLTRFILE